MKSFLIGTTTLLVVLLALLHANGASAFVKGSPATRTRPLTISSSLHAAAKKGAKKAAAKKGAKAAKKVAPETFKKSDFVASVAEKTGMSKTDSEGALMAVLDTITEQVVAGKRVSLVGFGTFNLRARSARKGRNPQTGEEIQIKASNSPGFTASKAFKEKANE